MRFVIAVIACALFAPLAANALSLEATYIVQLRLNELGFDAGKPDGRVGPATRRAFERFSDAYGGDSDAESVLSTMMQRSLGEREWITDPAELSAIKENVAEGLRDPGSAEIRKVYRVKSSKTTLICGEVNGKNAYGGYAGYTAFFQHQFSPPLHFYSKPYIDGSDSNFSLLSCSLAFPNGLE